MGKKRLLGLLKGKIAWSFRCPSLLDQIAVLHVGSNWRSSMIASPFITRTKGMTMGYLQTLCFGQGSRISREGESDTSH
jgi:hypothetical protein